MIDERKMEVCINEVVEEYGVEWDSSREYIVSVDVWKNGYNRNEHMQVDASGYLLVLAGEDEVFVDVTNISRADRLKVNNIALDYYINSNEILRANGPVS